MYYKLSCMNVINMRSVDFYEVGSVAIGRLPFSKHTLAPASI